MLVESALLGPVGLIALLVAVVGYAIWAKARAETRGEIYDLLRYDSRFRMDASLVPDPQIPEMAAATDHVQGERGGFGLHVFENSSDFVEQGKSPETRTVVMLTRPDWQLPEFRIGPRNFAARMDGKLAGDRRIEFPRDAQFDEACFVKGKDSKAIRAALVPEATQYLRENRDITIESHGHALLFYEEEAILSLRRIEDLLDLAVDFANHLAPPS